MTTLVAAFQRRVQAHPDRLALRSLDGTQITWREYGAAVERAAGALAARGLTRGDRVALQSPNCVELAVADLAALHLGASTVALYPQAPVDESLDAAGAILISDLALDEPAPSGFSFTHAWRAVRPENEAAVLFTSGTTGSPKGVRWTHAGALGWASAFQACSAETGDAHDIAVAPFASAAERAAGHWRSFLHGGTRTFCPDPAQLPQALAAARPTFLFGSPRMWQMLLPPLRAHGAEAVGLDRMQWAITAGAPCPPHLRRQLIKLGVPLRELYGMTETGGATITGPDDDDVGTVGRAMPGWETRIADDGEIELRAAAPAAGYLDGPIGTADGWVQSGDLGARDAQGRLVVVGRKKDVLVPLHGHNVSPSRIEAELLAACPGLAHACVVGDGRPHLAALLVTPDAPEAAVAQAVARVNAQLDPRERVEAHLMLREPWTAGRELTENLKLRRDRIAARYAREIEGLYGQ